MSALLGVVVVAVLLFQVLQAGTYKAYFHFDCTSNQPLPHMHLTIVVVVSCQPFLE